MKLKDLFPKFKKSSLFGDLTIKGVSDDSRNTKKGDLFFITERKNFDIFSVLSKVEPKVSAFVADLTQKKEIKSLIKSKPVIFVTNIKEEFYRVANLTYKFKKKSLKIIGITGTNGKTTTAYLLYHLLKKMNKPVSLIGTVKYLIGQKSIKPVHTTPDFLELRKLLQKAAKAGSHFVVMEVSSHALSQNRVKGVEFSRRIFTNLSRDHLDYHKTMKSYFQTKRKLFLTGDGETSIINVDDAYGRKIFNDLKGALSYGIHSKSDFWAKDIVLSRKGSEFDLVAKNKTYHIKTRLCGKHNVLNILGAIATVYSLGFPMHKIIRVLVNFKNAEGRLERIGKDIFIDYAHTPDALKNAILTLKNIGYKGIISVFGCGGDRDKGKRKEMGKVSANYSDFTFITSDNPRSEKPLKICYDIAEGFNNKSYSITIDRKKAIEKAIELFIKKRKTNNNWSLLIAGKGHENYQIVADKKIAFKDSIIVKNVLKKRKIKG